MPEIKVENLTVTYKTKKEENTPLENLSCTFESGKFSAIIGYSGCGKTTLLKSILGTQEYNGLITFDDLDANEMTLAERNISFVSQEYVLYPHLTIFDNIAFPLKLLKAPQQEIISRVYEIAEMLDIKMLLSRKPKHLSGGQQQRVAIARALVKRPAICLFDEPLSNLDNKTRMDLRYRLKKAINACNTTTIYVTHDFNEATALADKIYVLNNKRIELCLAPKEIIESENEVVKSLKYNEASSDAL